MSGSGSIVFILNIAAGASEHAALPATIGAHCAECKVEGRVVLASSGSDLQQAARDAVAAGAAVVVAGGGDGTINTIASQLTGSGIPLGILPLGTLNHFAKDLGIPLALDEALDVIVRGHTRRVDLGEVNGHLFLNNSSLGLYARIVRLRQQYSARGAAKWLVAAWAMLKVLQHNPSFVVRLAANGTSGVRRTSLVMVGNNRYLMEGFDAGSRPSLSDGRLAVYVVTTTSRAHLARLVWRIITGRARQDDTLETYEGPEITVETGVPRLPVALDGEVMELETPLTYCIRPGALTVVVPTSPE